MKKLRLGVVFDQQIDSGGGYQQSINAALAARQIPEHLTDIFFYTTFKIPKATIYRGFYNRGTFGILLVYLPFLKIYLLNYL